MSRRSRDRRGRGLRGGLAPPGAPLARTRSERFDELVLEAVERLEGRWGAQLQGVVFAVEEVPPVTSVTGSPTQRPADDPGEEAARDNGPVPLGRTLPGSDRRPPRVVIHRRPVESRAVGRARAALVHDVVIEQVAELLGLEPEAVDPDYGRD